MGAVIRFPNVWKGKQPPPRPPLETTLFDDKIGMAVFSYGELHHGGHELKGLVLRAAGPGRGAVVLVLTVDSEEYELWLSSEHCWTLASMLRRIASLSVNVGWVIKRKVAPVHRRPKNAPSLGREMLVVRLGDEQAFELADDLVERALDAAASKGK